jgi:hypothetical protein
VGHRLLDRLGRDQHAHGHRHAGALVRRQLRLPASGPGLPGGAPGDLDPVPAAVLPADVHRL